MSEIQTFKKEITFLSKVFNSDPQINAFETVEVTKEVTFRDLSRTDRSQAKLHFMLISIFEQKKKDDEIDESDLSNGLKVNSDMLVDITVKAIKTLLIVGEGDVTEAEKTEILNDTVALFSFGWWFMNEKITPFFVVLISALNNQGKKQSIGPDSTVK